jgi:hypothetical protein
MKETEGRKESLLSEGQKFDTVMRKMLSVTREELKKREKNWQRKRAKKKRATS